MAGTVVLRVACLLAACAAFSAPPASKAAQLPTSRRPVALLAAPVVSAAPARLAARAAALVSRPWVAPFDVTLARFATVYAPLGLLALLGGLLIQRKSEELSVTSSRALRAAEAFLPLAAVELCFRSTLQTVPALRVGCAARLLLAAVTLREAGHKWARVESPVYSTLFGVWQYALLASLTLGAALRGLGLLDTAVSAALKSAATAKQGDAFATAAARIVGTPHLPQAVLAVCLVVNAARLAAPLFTFLVNAGRKATSQRGTTVKSAAPPPAKKEAAVAAAKEAPTRPAAVIQEEARPTAPPPVEVEIDNVAQALRGSEAYLESVKRNGAASSPLKAETAEVLTSSDKLISTTKEAAAEYLNTLLNLPGGSPDMASCDDQAPEISEAAAAARRELAKLRPKNNGP